MNTGTELWLFAVSLGASALGGMLGMASGIFIVPVLTMFGHVARSDLGAFGHRQWCSQGSGHGHDVAPAN